MIACTFSIITNPVFPAHTFYSISSTMSQNPRTAARMGRKRRPDLAPMPESSGNLIFEDPVIPEPTNNVVDEAKVKQYINKLSLPDDQNVSSCIKVVICDTESDYFTPEVQEQLQQDFGISSISISQKAPRSVDRIVTIHGNLKQALAAVLFIAFVLNSNINNIVKVEPFTLKLQNYHVDVLVESSEIQLDKHSSRFPNGAMDYGQFGLNRKLFLTTLSGDLSSVFNSLTYVFLRFPYKAYAVEPDIEILKVTPVADPGRPKTEKTNLNEELLKFIYSKSFLDKK